MTGKQKIFSVLKDIKRESEINPDPEWVEFKFNTSVVGAGLLTDDQEKRILMKIEKDGMIEFHLPDGRDDEEEAMLSSYSPTEFMMEHNIIWIKILPLFYRKYFWYHIASFTDNKWNYVNPFWILWHLVKVLLFFIKWIWHFNKILTAIVGIIAGLLVYDWSQAWASIRLIVGWFIKIFF